jgi:hypothetical protein
MLSPTKVNPVYVPSDTAMLISSIKHFKKLNAIDNRNVFEETARSIALRSIHLRVQKMLKSSEPFSARLCCALEDIGIMSNPVAQVATYTKIK